MRKDRFLVSLDNVQYTGKGGNTQRYACKGTFSAEAVNNCIGFGGMRVDRVVAQEVLDRLQPLGSEAALAAVQAQMEQRSGKRRQIENAVQQAQYEAARARRQYDTVDPENRQVASELARQLPDMATAAILNRSGKLTGRGATWTRAHVCGLRNTHGIPAYREGERVEREEATLDEAADILKVSRATAYRMVSRGILPARQLCAGAPWIIGLADLQQDTVRRDAEARRSRRPVSQDPLQNSSALQGHRQMSRMTHQRRCRRTAHSSLTGLWDGSRVRRGWCPSRPGRHRGTPPGPASAGWHTGWPRPGPTCPTRG